MGYKADLRSSVQDAGAGVGRTERSLFVKASDKITAAAKKLCRHIPCVPSPRRRRSGPVDVPKTPASPAKAALRACLDKVRPIEAGGLRPKTLAHPTVQIEAVQCLPTGKPSSGHDNGMLFGRNIEPAPLSAAQKKIYEEVCSARNVLLVEKNCY